MTSKPAARRPTCSPKSWPRPQDARRVSRHQDRPAARQLRRGHGTCALVDDRTIEGKSIGAGQSIHRVALLGLDTVELRGPYKTARLYVHQPPTLEVQPGSGADGFTKNLTAIRAEERLALAAQRPQGLCVVTSP